MEKLAKDRCWHEPSEETLILQEQRFSVPNQHIYKQYTGELIKGIRNMRRKAFKQRGAFNLPKKLDARRSSVQETPDCKKVKVLGPSINSGYEELAHNSSSVEGDSDLEADAK